MNHIIRSGEAAYDPQRITFLSMTRGRPQQFIAMCHAVARNVARPELTDIWCYVDDDDPTVPDLVNHLRDNPPRIPVNWLIAPRPLTLGAGNNDSARVALETSGVVLLFPDDYHIRADGWDERVREAYDRIPGRLALHYIPDPISKPEQITIVAASKEWFDTLGYLIPPYFPFWFGDTWLDDVTQMAQVKRRLDLDITADEKGKTTRMWNVPFWQRFFECTKLERISDALRIAEAVGNTERAELLRAVLAELAAQPVPWRMDGLPQVVLELILTAETGSPSKIYLEAEAFACNHLAEQARKYPEAFADFPVSRFSVADALKAESKPGGVRPFEQFAIYLALLRGEPLGALAVQYGVSVGRMLEWRNAAAMAAVAVEEGEVPPSLTLVRNLLLEAKR